jgi:ParB-like nuclease domain
MTETVEERIMSKHWNKMETKLVAVTDIHVSDRIIEPTKARIDAMAESLAKIGQLVPISVSRNLSGEWKLITGATRLAAAKKAGWKYIEAAIISADNDFEYQLLEIAENLDRYDLSDAERAKLKAQEKELLAKCLAQFKEMMMAHPSRATVPEKREHAATGKPKGRPKGGIRDAARKAGIPATTARRKVKGHFAPKTKVAQNADKRQLRGKCPECGRIGFLDDELRPLLDELLAYGATPFVVGKIERLLIAHGVLREPTERPSNTHAVH